MVLESGSSKLALIFGVIILVFVLHSPFARNGDMKVTMTQRPTLVPHFPGSYGSSALENLTYWSSSLFEKTMLMKKNYTENECKLNNCTQAIMARRAVEPKYFEKYNLFNPYVTCPGGEPMQKMGGSPQEPDAGKWLCVSLLKPPCTIFSLGSNGDFSFEQAMLKATKCNIFTYDCTYNGRDLPGGRHKYLKTCLGTAAKAAQDPERFTTIQNAMEDLKLDKIQLLKIDIEGYEFDTLSAWRQLGGDLPEQVAIEIHHSEVIYMGGPSQNNPRDFSNLLWPMHDLTESDLALYFNHLAGLGYGIASRDDNPMGRCCSEFLLLKVGDWKS